MRRVPRGGEDNKKYKKEGMPKSLGRNRERVQKKKLKKIKGGTDLGPL